MRRKYTPFSLPPWARQLRDICGQMIIPIAVFQLLRTIFFPTTFDVFILALLVVIAVAFEFNWI
ncbi:MULTISPECIES: hypothetical protein [Bacillaceae]|uniref:hypothetical protein n=1 Tax=Bacillaceae TaxID=186817 RepID=UPI001BDDDA99|nr:MULTISPECIES: hypothetical protein [Bacillaceae]MDX8359408.1 hypothetical protein [Cytobacillus sp. IB215316]MDX8364043.1 hypothetical protein [Cytobacillus sp. IB215665]